MTTSALQLAGAVGWPEEFAERYRREGLWLGQTISEWFAERAHRFADRTAIVDGCRRLNYFELQAGAQALAGRLNALGLVPHERLVLQLPNGALLLQVLLATWQLGAVAVLALPPHRAIELTSFCQRSQASFLVVAGRHAGTSMIPVIEQVRAACPLVRQTLVSEGGQTLPPGMSALSYSNMSIAPEQIHGGTTSGEVALLQLSGGSTGVPKLIARTHDDYLYSVRASAELCGLGPDSRYLAVLPMTHNFTLSSPGVLGVLDTGGTIICCSHPSPECVFDLIQRERITITAAVPSLVRTWVDAQERRGAPVQLNRYLLQVGGAKLDAELARRACDVLGCEIQQVFGMAEGLVNYTRLDDDQLTRFSTQGRPLSSYDEVRVVDPRDPEGLPLPQGQLGELHTRGPYTIRGYFDDRAGDARHFTRNGFYRTGDLVRQNADGGFVVEGRLGDRILRGGEKIAPEEVERHLGLHPAVREAAVVGIADEVLGQRSHAFVVLHADMQANAAELRKFLRERGLAEFKLPDVVHLRDVIPRTNVGKTDRASLRKLHREAVKPIRFLNRTKGHQMAIFPIASYPVPTAASLPPSRAAWRLNPRRAALLVHDMQEYFLEPFDQEASPISEVSRNVKMLHKLATRAAMPVFFSAQPGEQSEQERGLLFDLWGPGIVKKPEAQALGVDLVLGPTDVLVLKRRYSAFYGTSLLESLAQRGCDQLIVCGVYAHIGCLATATDGFMRGIKPFVVADATADFSAEDHSTALRQVARTCGVVSMTSDILAIIALQVVSQLVEELAPEAAGQMAVDDDLGDHGLDSLRLMMLSERVLGPGHEVDFDTVTQARSLDAFARLLLPAAAELRDCL